MTTSLSGYSNWIDKQLEEASELLESGVAFGNKDCLINAFNHYHKLHSMIPGEEISYKIVRALTALCMYDEANGLNYMHKALQYSPKSPEVLNNLALMYKKQKGDYESAMKYYRECLESDPEFAQGYIGIIDVYRTLRMHELELAYAKTAVKHCPDSPDLYNVFGLAMINAQKLSDVASIHRIFDKALSLCTGPEHNVVKSKIFMNKGHLQGVVGNFEIGIDLYLDAIQTDPENKLAYQNILLNLHYFSDEDTNSLPIQNLCKYCNVTVDKRTSMADIIDQIHVVFADAMYGKDIRANATQGVLRSPDVSKKLRIGYLSSDLVTHAVSYFAKALFTHHNRDLFEIYVYSETIYDESTVAQFGVASFKFVNDLTAEVLANTIKRDEIDILVDLNGHTRGNRLDAVAKRPAPLVVTYLGYPDKIGIPYVKRLSDKYTERTHVDKEGVTLCLDRLFLCYTPSDMYAQYVKNYDKFNPKGTITFGSYAKPQKINDHVIALWCRILERLPNSRLIIKSRYFEDPKIGESWKARFGKVAKQVHLLKGGNHVEHMKSFRLIDIQLDTFPYSGTTITTESLFMNVPVITLCPEHKSKGVGHVHRVSGAILATIGMEEQCVARTKEEYVEKAVNLVGKLKEIGVRNRMLRSPMCDPNSFMKEYEEMLASAWVEQP